MVVLLYNPNLQPDGYVLQVLEKVLRENGQELFVDRRSEVNIQHAQQLVDWIKGADCVIAILSAEEAASETLEFQLETASTEFRLHGYPKIITIAVNLDRPILGPVGSYSLDERTIIWNSKEDDQHLVDSVFARLNSGDTVDTPIGIQEPAAAVPPSNRFYTLRQSDSEMDGALWGAESVILVRGPRQIGKTSLIGRGGELASALGWRTVSTDFQKLNAFQLTDVNKFCLLLAKTMARQLGFQYDFTNEWVDDFGPNLNLDHFVKSALQSSDERLIWFMDEADRIFTTPFASDFYGLVRSWHNSRATDPGGPWSRFTVVIGYATEARLFIQDLNQSPFNVGKQITLESFNLHQTTDLNVRYGGPLSRRSDLEALQFLLGGQPMLTRRAFEMLTSGSWDFSSLIEKADHEDGPFADHLKRVLYAVSQAPAVLDTLRASLSFFPVSDSDSVQRLISAGILKENAVGQASLACDLYSQYLARHLG